MFRISLFRLAFWLILCAGFYAGCKYLQVYFYASEFEDFIKDEVKFAPTRESTEEDHLRGHISDAAGDYGMTVDPDAIQIRKTQDTERQINTLEVDVPYTAPLDLRFFTRELHFETDASITY